MTQLELGGNAAGVGYLMGGRAFNEENRREREKRKSMGVLFAVGWLVSL